ncbi:hypothetical protein EYC80_005259 [Monilinia laxa]|nr:hypothetical protein EYC80_005259 [Monilinia laxa]
MQSWTASNSWAFAASKPRTYKPKTLSQSFLKGDWNCPECGFHNFASRDQCKCGQPRKPTRPINSKKLPAPIGPYSHAMTTPTAVYVSGQLPVDLDGNLVEGTISEKTGTVLQNLSEVLSAAGSSLEKVFKVQVFLTDMKDLAEMNEEYEKWIKHKPARSCVAVKELPKGVDIEIECIATP